MGSWSFNGDPSDGHLPPESPELIMITIPEQPTTAPPSLSQHFIEVPRLGMPLFQVPAPFSFDRPGTSINSDWTPPRQSSPVDPNGRPQTPNSEDSQPTSRPNSFIFAPDPRDGNRTSYSPGHNLLEFPFNS